MLELDEDEGGLGDVADFSGAEHDALECAPALGHQGEAPFAQAAQQRVAGPGIQVKLPAACWPIYRDMDAAACAFVPGVGQCRHVFQEGPQDGEDVLTGGGDVMDAAGQDRRDPQRDAGRGEQGLDVPAEAVRLAGVPPVDLLAFPADGLLLQPVGNDDLAVQDQVGQPLIPGRSRASCRAGARAATTVMASSR